MAFALLLSLSCFLVCATQTMSVLIEDYTSTRYSSGFYLNGDIQPTVFEKKFDYCQMLEDGSVRLYNILGGGNIQGEIVTFLLPRSANISTERYFQKIPSTEAEKVTIINEAVAASSAATTLPNNYVYSSAAAYVWTWDISLNEQDSGWTVQATLTTDSVYSFLIFSYCARDFGKLMSFNPEIGIVNGDKPVITFPANVLSAPGFLGQDNRNIVQKYVFRVDRLTCTQDPQFYCLKDHPKRFGIANATLTATTVNLFFTDDFSLDKESFEAYDIEYSLTCTDSSGVRRVQMTTKDQSEMKAFAVTNLSPNTRYTCVLSKQIEELDFTAERKELSFTTHFIRPNVAPASLTAETHSEEAAVSLSWQAIPFSRDFGTLTYLVKVLPQSGPAYLVQSTADTTKTIAGLQRGMVYTFTVSAANDIGTGPSSEEVSIEISPLTTDPPTSSTASQPTTSSVSSVTEAPSSTDSTEPSSSPSSSPTATVGVQVDTSTPDGSVKSVPPLGTGEPETTELGQSTTDSSNVLSTVDPTTSSPTVKKDELASITPSIFSFTTSEIAAVALGGVYAVSMALIIVLMAVFCAYRCHKRRKTYVVNRSSSTSSSQEEPAQV